MELLDQTAVITGAQRIWSVGAEARSLKVDGSAPRGTRTCKGSLAVGNR
jgi:hypothetical protein